MQPYGFKKGYRFPFCDCCGKLPKFLMESIKRKSKYRNSVERYYKRCARWEGKREIWNQLLEEYESLE